MPLLALTVPAVPLPHSGHMPAALVQVAVMLSLLAWRAHPPLVPHKHGWASL